jgi:uncharacterized membrane protein
MMSPLQGLMLFFHWLGAVTWIGGNFFLALTGPAARAGSAPEGLQSMRLMGLRFRWISWIAVAVLVLTGIGNLYYVGLLTHFDQAMQTVPFLGWKLLVVLLMIIVKVLHDFVVAPRAARNPRNRRLWTAAMLLGRGNVVLGIVVLYLAMRLAHG